MNTFSSGKITNIFSNDASQIETSINSINHLWVIDVHLLRFYLFNFLKFAPFDIMAMVISFWYFVKYVAFIPIGYTVVLVLLVSFIGHLLVHLR